MRSLASKERGFAESVFDRKGNAMLSARMTSRGRVTIPARIRAELGLKAGDVPIAEKVGTKVLLRLNREDSVGSVVDVPSDAQEMNLTIDDRSHEPAGTSDE